MVAADLDRLSRRRGGRRRRGHPHARPVDRAHRLGAARLRPGDRRSDAAPGDRSDGAPPCDAVEPRPRVDCRARGRARATVVSPPRAADPARPSIRGGIRGGGERRGRTLPGRLGRLRPTRARAGARTGGSAGRGPGAAGRRPRPVARRRAARRPQARQRGAAARGPGRVHRLADDVARAAGRRPRLVPGLQQRVAAGEAGIDRRGVPPGARVG